MITFLKGDTTASITLALAEGFDYSGKTVHLEYQGVQLAFPGAVAGGSLVFCFTARETASMSLGAYSVHAWIEDGSGNVTTIHNADVKMRVTDCIADVHGGSAIYLDIRGGLFGIDGLPERYTDKDVHDKINEILRRCGGTVAALLLCALPAFGVSLTLHTAPKGAIYNDEHVVTGVVFSATGLAEAANVYTKAETEAKIVELAPAPDFSTNNTALVETIEATAPVPGDYATVSNRAMTALQSFTETDPTVPKWAKSSSKPSYSAAEVGAVSLDGGRMNSGAELSFGVDGNGLDIYFGGIEISDEDDGHSESLFIDYNSITHTSPRGTQTLTFPLGASDFDAYTKGEVNAISATIPNNITRTGTDATLVHADGGSTTNLIYIRQASSSLAGLMTAADKSAFDTMKTTVSEHETAIQTVTDDNTQTRQIVTTWEDFLDGSNVVFSITNYISGAYNLDAAKMTIKELRDGEYHEVYNSRDEILLHINDFSNRYVHVAIEAVVDMLAQRLAEKADKDWGKYTSAGGEAPSNTVYMTAPNTVFAGGLEYERVAVGEGSICVLTTRGAPVWTQGDEGTFKFQDDGGTNYFGFAKTDSYTIGANTDGITVQGGMVTMNYNITMSGRPCVWYKSSLSSGAWEQLNLPDGSPVAGASHAVTWEQNPPAGTQVCYINVGNQPQGFFRATVEVAGEAKFMTNMPADLSGGIICTNTATGVNGVIKPAFNGSSVIWNWSAK